MKILTAEEIRNWDKYTIQYEPILSIDLMERAAIISADWIKTNYPEAESFAIFCGKGNNGGDGLAIARLLVGSNSKVSVYILEFGHKGTDDFQTNLARLHKIAGTDIHFIQHRENFHPFPPGQIIIDALFGSGLNRAVEGVTAELIEHINRSGHPVISIDIPSGLFTDRSSLSNPVIHATDTLSFQCYKPAFLFAENEPAIGEVIVLGIGLDPRYYEMVNTSFEMIDRELVTSIHQPRKRFAHKGNFGHALLLAGSRGKIGAAVLAARACIRSGSGLLTCHVPGCSYTILQSTVPEAMLSMDPHEEINTKLTEEDLTKFEAIGIGPGIGIAAETKMLLREIFDTYRSPIVIDADALNIIGTQKDLLKFIPAGSILTPHPKEFTRLFGESANDFDRVQLALVKARELNCIIVLKGHYTFIATPDGIGRPTGSLGRGFFNSTGNAGMAKGGSGDVLTGILTGLLAQEYSSVETALLGVYLHGLAGDLAAMKFSQESMTASDIIECIGSSFLELQRS